MPSVHAKFAAASEHLLEMSKRSLSFDSQKLLRLQKESGSQQQINAYPPRAPAVSMRQQALIGLRRQGEACFSPALLRI